MERELEKREKECPKCGDTYTVRCGFNMTKKGRRQRRQCMCCGSTFYEKREVAREGKGNKK